MASQGIGDFWAFGKPYRPFMSPRKKRWSAMAAVTAFFTIAMVGIAWADMIAVDGDSLTIDPPPNPSVTDCTVPHVFNGSARISYSGGSHFAGGATLSVTVTAASGISAVGPLSVTLPSPWASGSTHTFAGVDTTVPAGVSSGTYKVTVTASGTKSGGGTLTIEDFFNVNVTCAAVNNPPTIAWTVAPSEVGESTTTEHTYTFSITDPDSSAFVFAAGYPMCGAGGTLVQDSESISGTTGTFKCLFPDGPASPEVKVKVLDDEGAASDEISQEVAVANVAPTVTASMDPRADCRTNATLSLKFSDPGVDDWPWHVVIDWGDPADSTDTEFDVSQQDTVSPSPTHMYVGPGGYNVVVSVTDKDNGTGIDSDNAITIDQTYAVDFLPPFDDSSPSDLIVNKMKNGRVVPVKATIYDECALSYVTDPASVVTIKTSKTAITGTGDPVEEYADAGSSSAGTDEFRWSTDGFWIYNLDSKALGLVVGNAYRVDVKVGEVCATVDTWAVLQPVK